MQRLRRFEKAPIVRLTKRRVRQLLGSELRHFNDVAIGTQRVGDWVFHAAALRPGGIVYSLGVGDDLDLDLVLLRRYAQRVWAFDPTPGAIAWLNTQQLPPQFHFQPIGIAGCDGSAAFAAPVNRTNPSYRISRGSPGAVVCEVRKLSTVAAGLGHEHIDLLKMDVEGAEYDVVEDLLSCNLHITQLLIEFHHRFREVGRERTARAVAELRAAGYRVFNISPSGREYSFIHADALKQPARP